MSDILLTEDKNEKSLKDLRHDLEYTISNCSNMHNRLCTSDRLSKFLIIEYSLFSIVNSLIPKYFSFITSPDSQSRICSILDFVSVNVSIILLVASLYISLANYSDRITKAMTCLNKLKRLKKKLENFSPIDFTQETRNEYNEIVDDMECRSDLDFYKTCKVKNFIHHNFSLQDHFLFQAQIFFFWLFRFLLVIFPLLFYLFCFIYR